MRWPLLLNLSREKNQLPFGFYRFLCILKEKVTGHLYDDKRDPAYSKDFGKPGGFVKIIDPFRPEHTPDAFFVRCFHHPRVACWCRCWLLG